MSIESVDWLAVAIGTISAFLVGSIWFSPKTFFPVWWKALGKEAGGDPGAGQSMGVVFGLTALGALVQAFVLALVVGVIRSSGTDVNFLGGALVGALMGVGFVAAPALGHRLFGQQGLKVWAIESGGDILGLIAMGAVIGAFA